MAVWATLATVLAGGFIGIAGSWVNNSLQARETKRARAEQFAREDHLRNLDHRREIYAQYARLLRTFFSVALASHEAGLQMNMTKSKHGEESLEAAADTEKFSAASFAEVERSAEVFSLLAELELLASPAVVTEARTIVDVYMNWSWADEPTAFLKSRQDFLRAARIELGLSDVGRTPI